MQTSTYELKMPFPAKLTEEQLIKKKESDEALSFLANFDNEDAKEMADKKRGIALAHDWLATRLREPLPFPAFPMSQRLLIAVGLYVGEWFDAARNTYEEELSDERVVRIRNFAEDEVCRLLEARNLLSSLGAVRI